MQMFFIHDKVSGEINLFLARDVVSAKRSFVASMIDEKYYFSQYPDDYDLHYFPVFGLTYDGDSTDLEVIADSLLLKCPVLLSGSEARSAADTIKRRQSVRVAADATTAAATSSREAEKKE